MADLVALRPAKRRRRNGWKADPQKSYFAQVPNEILLLIATTGDEDLTLNSLKTIAYLARTSRAFYEFLNPILYHHGIKRHPYLLHWASRVGNLGTAQLAIAAGASLDAFFMPDKSFGCAPGDNYFSRWRRENYHEIHNKPYKVFRGTKSPNPKHKRVTLFRNFYRVHDIDIQWAGSRLTPKLTVAEFCNTQQKTAGYRELLRVSDEMNSLTQGTWSHTAAPKYSCSVAPIHLAVIGGHCEIITELLLHGADINAPSHYLCDCALRHEHSAVRVAPFHLVRSAFKPDAYGSAVKRDIYPWTWTALHVALCHNQEAAFWLLFSIGARSLFAAICGSNFFYNDVLHHTIALQRWPIAKMLIDNHGFSTEVSKKDSLGVTPIWVAYYDNKMDIVSELLHYGAKIDEDLGNGFTPLIHACMFGRWKQAIDLINLGASIDTRFIDYHCEDIYRYEHENGRVLQGAMYRPLDLVVTRWTNPSSSSIWNEAIEGRYQPVGRALRAQQEMTLMDLLLDRGAELEQPSGLVAAGFVPSVEDLGEPQVGINDFVYSVPQSIDTVSNAAAGHQMRHLDRIIRSDQFKSYFKKYGHRRILWAMLGPSHCPNVPRERAGDRGKWAESWVTENANRYHCGCFKHLNDHLVRHGYPGFMEEE
ncbi:ankyrin repeat-containing domain protein [Apiosordaria backusii]|uniref:Ankyrin repeat-containing domain protein n=1 Tax=Apiosordaria backusii TaxID=314023 RepID=A0AA40EX88_9PEZI|nr:ankyrin repeat-containing domain protein [Apiosordaria backusii]